MLNSELCSILGIEYPIFQGGMAWIADGKLAAAVSEAGGLGIISAMNAGADYLKKEIETARSRGVNRFIFLAGIKKLL